MHVPAGLTYEAEHEAEHERPEAEAGVPAVVVTDEHHAQEHEDDGVARLAVGTHPQLTSSPTAGICAHAYIHSSRNVYLTVFLQQFVGNSIREHPTHAALG